MKLFVSGVEKEFAAGSLNIDHQVEERSTADLSINDDDGTQNFSQGASVEVWDGADIIFGGVVESIIQRRIAKGPAIRHDLRMADWHYLVDKRLAAKSYDTATAGAIAMDLWSEYLRQEGIRAFDYKSVVLDDGPVGYWRMGEREGTTVTDSSGNGFHGTHTGSYSAATGALTGDPDPAVDLPGTSYVTASNPKSVAGEGSIEAWVHTGSWDDTARHGIFQNMPTWGNVANGVSLFRYSNANPDAAVFYFRIVDPAGTLQDITFTWPTWFERDEWNHVVGTWSSSTMTLYINGEKKTSKTITVPNAFPNTDVNLWRGHDGSLLGKGDELAVYDRALTSVEVMEHYLTGKQALRNYSDEVLADDPVAYWRLGDTDIAAQATDSSGGGIDGAITGTTAVPGLLNFDPDDAREFDGLSYVNCGTPAALQITGAQTYEFWCRPDSFATRKNPINKAYGGEGTMTQEPNGTINYYCGSAGTNATPHDTHNSVTALVAGEVYHVVHTRSSGAAGATMKWYINGVKTSEATTVNAVAASTMDFMIGDGYVDGYVGVIDDVAVYNTALSEERILTHYLVGKREPKFVSAGSQIEQATVNYAPVSQAMEELAELSGYAWNVDPTRLLHFRSRADIAGPRTVAGTEMQYGTVQVEISQPKYRNRQYIKGGRDLTDSQTETQYGDGEKKAFTLGYPVGDAPKIETSRSAGVWVTETVGIKGADSNKQWYYAKGDQVLRQDNSEVALTSADLIRVTYRGEYDVVAISEDNAEITRMANLTTGSTGWVEVVNEEPQASNRAAAFERANAKINRYGREGRLLRFETRQSGLEVGQLVAVDLPAHGFNGQSLLVSGVGIRDDDGKNIIYDVTLLEGPINGSWAKMFDDLFQSKTFVERVNIGQNEILTLLNNTQESWAWTENNVDTVRACAILTATMPFNLC